MLENLQKTLQNFKINSLLGQEDGCRGGMQCDSRLKIVLEIEISKTSKKKGPRCPYKKN